MRGRRVGAIVAGFALTAGALVATGAPTALAATDVWVGTVNNGGSCSDQDPGTAAQPLCNLQTALDRAVPGQTVHLRGEQHVGAVLTRSGTPAAPITVTAESGGAIRLAGATATGLTLSGAHDIVLRGLVVAGSHADGIAVHAVAHLLMDRVTAFASLPLAGAAPFAAVHVDAASSDVTLTRSAVGAISSQGLLLDAGASGVTVTDTQFVESGTASAPQVAVSAASPSALILTSDSFKDSCSVAVRLSGAGSATVENSVVARPALTSPGCPAVFQVDAAAAPGTHLDYNGVAAASDTVPYRWAGTEYATPAAFTTASGQGAHDLFVPRTSHTGTVATEGSPLIDSADPDAPALPATDQNGASRVDDPLVGGDTAGHVDRGATERRDDFRLVVSAGPASAGSVPAAVTETATFLPTTPWGLTSDVRLDWGDGTSEPLSTGIAATHTYATPGAYTLSTTAQDSGGSRQVIDQTFVAATAAPAAVTAVTSPFTLDAARTPSRTAARIRTSSSAPFQVTSEVLDFGNGLSMRFRQAGNGVVWAIPASEPGVYPVTVSDTDVLGRTTSTTKPLVLGDAFGLFGAPVNVYNGPRTNVWLAPKSRITIPLASLGPNLAGLAGAAPVLRVQVSKPAAAGFLQVFPATAALPATSTLDFSPGQTVSNLAMPGPTGNVAFYNASAGRLQLTVDDYGAMASNTSGSSFTVATPRRVVDTATGLGTTLGAIGARGTRGVRLAGVNGVPADATAVLVDVTTSHASLAGDLSLVGSGVAVNGVQSAVWGAGETRTTLALVPLVNGVANLHNEGGSSVDVALDLVGSFRATGPGAFYLPVLGSRIADTGRGVGVPLAKIPAHGSVTLAIGGRAGIPSSMTKAATLNLTTQNATAAGTLVADADGSAAPATTTLTYVRSAPTAGLAVVRTGANGRIRLTNKGSAPVDLLVDLQGIFYSY